MFGGRCGSTSPANPIYTIFGSEFGSVFFTQNNLVVLRDSHTITVIFLEIWIALIYMRNREKASI